MTGTDQVEIMIVEATVRNYAEDHSRPLEDRMQDAMNEAAQHWMVLDEQRQFKGAVAAFILHASPEEKPRVELSVKAITLLNALVQPYADTTRIIDDMTQTDFESVKTLPLMRMWQAAKEKARAR